MEMIYNFKADEGNIYLINGAFVEKPDIVRYIAATPLYVTVLPLSAVFLPYTVKILDGRVLTNDNLCNCYKLAPQQFLLRFKSRSNYVYTPSLKIPYISEEGLMPRFFKFVKGGQITEARGCLTMELSASLNDDNLNSFFNDYEDIVCDKISGNGGYLLLKAGAQAEKCTVAERSGLIDNIETY